MTTYRCLVSHSWGQFVAYAGRSFTLASDIMRLYEETSTTRLQRLDDDGWRTIVGVYRTHAEPERPDTWLLRAATLHALRSLTEVSDASAQ